VKRYLSLAVAAIAMVSMGACSSTTKAQPAAAMPSGVSASATPFGAACAMVPSDAANPGSFDAMSKVPVATAAAGNPMLSTLVTAVTKAGLGDTLNSTKNITVFAPDNDAFAKIPADTLNAVLADKAQLTKILTYHVVPGTLTPDQLAGTHKTLEGADLTITGSGTDFKVNNASIVCGDVPTANATVYIIDGVLMPQ
jgi:uncharacterized surface protein with fasciclin (FAS1) repeats